MRSKALIAVLFCMVPVMVCWAQDDYDIKVYPCARAHEAITIDGKLNEPSWQRAPLVGGFTHYNKPVLIETQTFFQIIYSQTQLVFGITCDEPLMERLVPAAQARDAKAVFSSEAIEIFIDPRHDHTDYYQFAANAAAGIFDGRRQDPLWNSGASAQVSLADDHWTLEFAIPWKDLKVTPEPGAVIGFNVCRDRLIGPTREWTNWAQTKANFHDPERFAHLVLSPTARMLGQMGAEFRKGERAGPIVVYSKSGFSQTTYRSLAKASVAKLDAMLAELAATAAAEEDPLTRRELDKLVAKYRADMQPIHAAVDGKQTIDAAEWTRMDLQVNQFTRELEDAIWQARLNALLSGL